MGEEFVKCVDAGLEVAAGGGELGFEAGAFGSECFELGVEAGAFGLEGG